VLRAGLSTRAAAQVRPDTPALDAMILMETRNISAVAVVAASGSIIANFSISELRCGWVGGWGGGWGGWGGGGGGVGGGERRAGMQRRRCEAMWSCPTSRNQGGRG
jgi:hypothetical protein